MEVGAEAVSFDHHHNQILGDPPGGGGVLYSRECSCWSDRACGIVICWREWRRKV